MKAINNTTTGDLFNHTGLLNYVGDYAGKYQQEAFDLITAGEEFMWTDESWADIMYNNKGICFAVLAEGELTSNNSECYYAEIDVNDCPNAFADMIEKEF